MATASIELRGSLLRPLSPLVLVAGLYLVALIVGHFAGLSTTNWIVILLNASGLCFLLWTGVLRPSLSVSEAGLGPDAALTRWSDLGLIWFETGSRFPRPMRYPVMWLYSAEQIAYTRRTGYPPMRLGRRPLALDRSPEQLAALLRAFAPRDVEVHSGPEREDFIAELRRQARVGAEGD